jgi:hypothetical protein
LLAASGLATALTRKRLHWITSRASIRSNTSSKKKEPSLEHRSLAYRSHATSGLDLSQFNVAAQSSEGWFVIEETRTVFFNPIGNLTVQDLYLVAPAMPEPASVLLFLSGAGTVVRYWKWKKHDRQGGG